MDDLPPSADSEPDRAPDAWTRVLLVGMPGLELQQVLPAERERDPWSIHIAQPRNPIGCSCGEVHTADEEAFLTLLIGQPDLIVRANKDALTMAMVPDLDQPRWPRIPYVAPDPDSGSFYEWAAEAVAHFTDFLGPENCSCTTWDNICILWEPSSDICGCGQERDPSQLGVPVCLPEHARLRFAAEPVPGSLPRAMERLLARSTWITPRCRRLMVALSLDANHGMLSEADEALGALSERVGEETKVLWHMPIALREAVPILSVLGG